MTSTVVIESVYPGWSSLWDDEESAAAWAEKQSRLELTTLATTIEQMLRNSIPSTLLASLRERWHLLPKSPGLCIDDQVCWNLFACKIDPCCVTDAEILDCKRRSKSAALGG